VRQDFGNLREIPARWVIADQVNMASHSAQTAFQFHDEIGMSPAGAARVDARIKICRRLQVAVAHLTDQLVGTPVGVENDRAGPPD
jgi:hypothetical protein